MRPHARPDWGVRNEDGAVLLVILIAALISTISLYALLQMAISQARRNRLHLARPAARHAAELGLVWAQQRLWLNPNDCFGASPDVQIDADADPSTPDMPVNVTATPCPPAPSQLTATVVY
jgi:hypothetical protein